MTFLTDAIRFLGRDTPALPVNVVGAGDSFIFTKEKTYIDFIMGWNVGNAGWNREEINRMIRNFTGPSYVNSAYGYERWLVLAEMIAKITPGGLTKCFRVTSGTEAVELALQSAMAYTRRSGFISIAGSYHGHSIGAMSIGDDYFRKYYKNLLPNCHKIDPPLDLTKTAEFERILKTESIAALIMEPVICNLGVIIPDKDFMKKIATDCRKYGTLLIADEVATGFGRTGKMFASEHFDLMPDIMCLGKAITNGHGVLGATVMTPEVAKAMEFPFSFYSTFGWHPLAVEAAIASIDYYCKNEIWKMAEQRGKILVSRLNNMAFEETPLIRSIGMAVGIEFDRVGYANVIRDRCLNNGLLISCLEPKLITLFPALNIDLAILHQGLDLFEKSL